MSKNLYRQRILQTEGVARLLGGPRTCDIPAAWQPIEALVYLVEMERDGIRAVVVFPTGIDDESDAGVNRTYITERERYDNA